MKQESKINKAVEELMTELRNGMSTVEKEKVANGLETIAQLIATTSVSMQTVQTIQITRLADIMEDIHERLIDINASLQNLR